VIRVLLADDQALVRAGFRALLDAQDDVEVVGEAGDGAEAVRLAVRYRPDVVLMDIRMPGLDGLEATRRIAADPALSGVRIVILTTFDLDEYVFEALRVGASGFLVKDTEPVDLLRGIRAVASGDALLSPGVTRRLIEEFASRARAPRPPTELSGLTEPVRDFVLAQPGAAEYLDLIDRLLEFSIPAFADEGKSRLTIAIGCTGGRHRSIVFAEELAKRLREAGHAPVEALHRELERA